MSESSIDDLLKKTSNDRQAANNPQNSNSDFKIKSPFVQLNNTGEQIFHFPKGLMKTKIDSNEGKTPMSLYLELYGIKNGSKDLLLYMKFQSRSYADYEVRVGDQILRNFNIPNSLLCFLISRHLLCEDSILVIDIKVMFPKLFVDYDFNYDREEAALSEFYSKFYYKDRSYMALILRDTSKNKNIYADFTIKCSDGVELKVHRVFLAHNSAYFMKLFTTDMQESDQNRVEFTDIDSETMENAMNYMYNYFHRAKTLDKVMNLYYAGDKFQHEGIQITSMSHLLSLIELSNVLEIFFFAELFSIDKVLMACLSTIMENYEKLKLTEEWKELTKQQFEKFTDAIFELNAKYPPHLSVEKLENL